MGSLLKRLTKVLNPVLGTVAAWGLIPIWGIVEHTGRKTGRRFATPIALARTSDGFIVPLPWGDRTDWCRNLVAAHGGVIRWRGAEHIVRDPQFIDRAAAAPAFPRIARQALGAFKIERFVHLRRIEPSQM